MSRFVSQPRRRFSPRKPAHHSSVRFSVDSMTSAKTDCILLQNIIEIYQNYTWKTEVLAASLRHPIHVIEARTHGRRHRHDAFQSDRSDVQSSVDGQGTGAVSG